MFETGSSKYKQQIKKLFCETFGDSEEVCDNFLENMYRNEDIVLYTESGKVFAMAFLLPVFCKNRQGRYVYAVATAPSHRNRGICRRLMAFAEEYVKNLGEDFLILVPASPSLFAFYESMGYCHRVFRPILNAEKKGILCTYQKYYEIREKNCASVDLINWSPRRLSYILSCGEPLITETGAVFFEGEKAIEILDENMFCGEEIPFALIKYLKNFKFQKPYFGLEMS